MVGQSDSTTADAILQDLSPCTRNVAGELLKLTALIGLTAPPRMQAEIVGVCAQRLYERRRAPWGILQAQHFAPCARPLEPGPTR